MASTSDYYPFGFAMGGRSASSGEYRYGFNGKEKDDKGEWGGEYLTSATCCDSEGNVIINYTLQKSQTYYDYGFRIYNPGIGRFLSEDPLTEKFPWYTPYQYAGNKPVKFIDLDGAEEWDEARQMYIDNQYGGTFQHVIDNTYLYSRVEGGVTKFWVSNTKGTGFVPYQNTKTERYKYRHRQTGTGFGLSVNHVYGDSPWMNGLKNITAKILAVNASGPLAAGVIGGMGSSYVGAYGSIELGSFAGLKGLSIRSLAGKFSARSTVNYLVKGSLTERAVAGGTDFVMQQFTTRITGSNYNIASTASAIFMPNRYVVSGIVGGGLNLGVTEDKSSTEYNKKYNYVAEVSFKNAFLGGVGGFAGGKFGDGLDNAIRSSGGSNSNAGIGLSHALRNIVGLVTLVVDDMTKGTEKKDEDVKQDKKK